MDADVFIDFMRKNSQHLRRSALKIMGGEPTLHPRISDIIEEAIKHYFKVNLFSNGLNIENVVRQFESKIMYTINGYTFNPDKFLSPKFFALHFVITKDRSEEVVEKIFKCMDLFPQMVFLYSADTQVNLFDDNELNEYRKVWLDATKIVIPEFKSRKIRWNTDHRFPICFFTEEMISELKSIGLYNLYNVLSCCKCEQIGLIDWNFDLYYCNQTRIKLGSVLNKSIPEINKMVDKAYNKKIDRIREINEKCKNCILINKCRVGCYYNKIKGVM